MIISNRKGSHMNDTNDEIFAKISPEPNVAELEDK